MTTSEIAEFLGFMAGSWAVGYMLGFGLLSIRKFFEQI